MSRRPQSWTRDLSSGEPTRFPLGASQQAVVAIAGLVDWATAEGADESVRVAVHANTGEEMETFVLSPESPLMVLRSPVMNQEFSVEVHSAAHAVVRLHGFLLTVPPEPGTADEELDMSCPGDDELVEMEYSPEVRRFLGGPAPWFAAAGCTAGCMRLAAVEGQEEGDSKQILLLYRYAPFSVSSDGVVARGSTRAHLLRFIATGDHAARSLAWAGSSLVRLIYPGDFSEQLQELWSSLAAQVSVLSRAARVEVFVDVGILRRSLFVDDIDGMLRRSYYMPERMEWMRAALEDMVEEPWPVRFTGMELHLPEPMRHDHDKDEASVDGDDTNAGERPAKRRRVAAAGEDCPICLQLLDGDDLAAWPGCGKPHVFHGACLERVLVESKACPMCRRTLYVEPK